MIEIRSLSELLLDFRNALKGENTSIGQILEAFHERGFGMVLFVFALPMALPVPVPPGINILLALPLLLLTAQQTLGRHVIWLPGRVKRKTLATKSLNTMVMKSLPWIRRMEHLARPRLAVMTSNGFSRLIGLFGFFFALAVCVPIPLSNTVPSLAIAIMAVGVLMRDGLAILLGMVIGTTWLVCLTSVLIFIGSEGIDVFKETLRSMV